MIIFLYKDAQKVRRSTPHHKKGVRGASPIKRGLGRSIPHKKGVRGAFPEEGVMGSIP